MMFVRRSKYRDLKEQHERAVEELAGWKGSTVRVAGRNTELNRRLEASRDVAALDGEYAGELESRLARLLRACVRYRAELTDETRRASHLQARLDDALGLNTAGIQSGKGWQDRREDKRVRGSA